MSERPKLSPTIAHALVMECPRQAWALHRLLGNMIQPTPEQLALMERGAALHNLVLEGGNRIEVVDADDWRKKAARDERERLRGVGKMPVLPHVYQDLQRSAAAITFALVELGLQVGEGHAEKRVFWTEPAQGGDVECTGVVDWQSADGGLLIDLKTTTGSVHPDACVQALANGPGITQAAAYTSATIAREPSLAGRVQTLFLFAQSKPPYMVTPIEPDGELAHIGETRWLRAIEKWQRCLAAGTEAQYWPAHSNGEVLKGYAPAWLLSRELAREEMEIDG